MKKVLLGIVAVAFLCIIAGVGALSMMSGLKSELSVGLSPEQHSHLDLNVRNYSDAPLGAEVKVYLPLAPEEAMSIVADFSSYGEWVDPAPDNVVVDNSGRSDGSFGEGSLVSYTQSEQDRIEFFEPGLGMIAKPMWSQEALLQHLGVVIAIPHRNGTLLHMRRYFVADNLEGWIMSKMMPIFMHNSAENLAERYNGYVY